MNKATKEQLEQLRMLTEKMLEGHCHGNIPERFDKETVLEFGEYALRLGVQAGKRLRLKENRIHQRNDTWNGSDSNERDFYIEPLSDR